MNPTEYTSASDPISKAVFVLVSIIGTVSGFGLLFKSRLGLLATYVVFVFLALVGLVAMLGMSVVGSTQAVFFLGISIIGFRYFGRRRAKYTR